MPRGTHTHHFFHSFEWERERRCLPPYFDPEPVEWEESSEEEEPRKAHVDGLEEGFLAGKAVNDRWWNSEFQSLVDSARVGRGVLFGRREVEARLGAAKRGLQLEGAFLETVAIVGKRLVLQQGHDDPTVLQGDKNYFPELRRPPFTEVVPNPIGSYIVLDDVPVGAGPCGKNHGGPIDPSKRQAVHNLAQEKRRVGQRELGEELGLDPHEHRLLEFREYTHDGIIYRVMEMSGWTAKVVGKYLRVQEALSRSPALEGFTTPLLAVVDFAGYRVYARALLPIVSDLGINRPLVAPELAHVAAGQNAHLVQMQRERMERQGSAEPAEAAAHAADPAGPKGRRAELMGTVVPDRSDRLKGQYVSAITPPRPIPKFGRVPEAHVPLLGASVAGTPSALGTINPKKSTATRAHGLMGSDPGSWQASTSLGGHGAGPPASGPAAPHSPHSPGRKQPQQPPQQRPATAGATPAAGGRAALERLSSPGAADLSAASTPTRLPPAGQPPPGASPLQPRPAGLPSSSLPSLPYNKNKAKKKEAQLLVQLEPSRPAVAPKLFYVANPGDPPKSARFLSSVIERTRLEAAVKGATEDVFENLRPRVLGSLLQLAQDMNLTVYAPASHAKLNSAHTEAWKKAIRMGEDDRLYLLAPLGVIPKEPLSGAPPPEKSAVASKMAARGQGIGVAAMPRSHEDLQKLVPYFRLEAIRRSPRPLASERSCTHLDCEVALLTLLKGLYAPKDPLTLAKRLLAHFADPWWREADEHGSVAGCLHFYGYHVKDLGELRKQLSSAQLRYSKDSDFAHAHLVAHLYEVVVFEIGIRVCKVALAAELRKARSTTVADLHEAARRALNLICGQSPQAVDFWRTVVAQHLHDRFGYSLSEEIEFKISGVLRRSVTVDNKEFFVKLQQATGVRVDPELLARMRQPGGAEALFSEEEPFPRGSVISVEVMVKGLTVPVMPGDVVTEEAGLEEDEARKLDLLSWAADMFRDQHAEQPYVPDHVIHWGMALAEKAHILTQRDRAARARLRGPEAVRFAATDSQSGRITDPSGLFAEAERIFRIALRLHPDNHRARTAFGSVLAQRAISASDAGLYVTARRLATQAQAEFEGALAARPGDTLIMANLGKALVVKATAFPPVDQHQPSSLFPSPRGKQLCQKAPKFARCLVILKVLQSVTAIQRGIALLEECRAKEPAFEFAKEALDHALIIYAQRFLSEATFVN